MMSKKRITQAVVVIHGIGEQRPMDTLRSFVDAVLPEPQQGGEKYFSKPDRLSESFELRKLQNRAQPRTHFYEYYWAYKVDGTKLSHVWSWLSSLLLRLPNRVPHHLQPLWLLSWLLIITAVAAAAAGVMQVFTDFTAQFPAFLISGLSTLAFAMIQGVIIHYLGDAARYLSPNARNIALRQKIRADGIKLIKSIHDSGDYDRVIVVGHSLGSVIAYDVLMHMWQQTNRVYDHPQESDQPALSAVEKAGQALTEAQHAQQIDPYQKAQAALWRELRDLGNPWLVTDLITLGSPLAHAALLLASDAPDLAARQRQRELPTDPPLAEIEVRAGEERDVYSFRVWERYEGDIQLRALHHAALYAPTRWTNLYFPVRWSFFGDLIAGPLRQTFGLGIRDIPLTANNWLRRSTLLSHKSYWRKELGPEHRPLALPMLIQALDLEGEDLFSEETKEENP